MSLLNGFNANEVEHRDFGGNFPPLPEGVYTLIIDRTEEKRTRNDDGTMLVLELSVLDEGDYYKRRLWVRLNLDNKSASSVAMARAELAQICKAIGVPQPRHHEELCGKPLLGQLKIKTDKPENRAVAYAPVGTVQPGPGKTIDGTAPAKTAAPSRPAANESQPWKRG